MWNNCGCGCQGGQNHSQFQSCGCQNKGFEKKVEYKCCCYPVVEKPKCCCCEHKENNNWGC